MRRTFLVFAIALTLSAQYQSSFKLTWLEPGSGEFLPEFDAFDKRQRDAGSAQCRGNPEDGRPPLFHGPRNERPRLRHLSSANLGNECVGLRPGRALARHRWQGPGLRGIRRLNCPGLPQDKESSHSLLLSAGSSGFRSPGRPGTPTARPSRSTSRSRWCATRPGCNSSREYGLKSAQPTISVYRRPRITANLKYVVSRRHSDPASKPAPWPMSIRKPESRSA